LLSSQNWLRHIDNLKPIPANRKRRNRKEHGGECSEISFAHHRRRAEAETSFLLKPFNAFLQP
jgi:hypothetical protein